MTRQVPWCALLIVAVVGLPKVAVAQSQQQPPPAAVVDALQQLRAEVAELREAVKPRQFYLTRDTATGSQALNACQSGFHMASLWEIFDVTNLKYDTARGEIRADSARPNPTKGKARGRASDPNNCAAWTTSDPSSYGTMVALGGLWETGLRPAPPANTDSIESYSVPWVSAAESCGFRLRVWCVQDR